MKTDTAWSRGSRLLFGQMYEDYDIEHRAFPPGSRVLCIASAGSTAIALSHGREVTAIDINPAQIDYARLRAEGGPPAVGAIELQMNRARKLVQLTCWNKGKLREFVELSNCRDQLQFWDTYLNTLAFRSIFDLLLGAASLGFRLVSPDRTLPVVHFGPIMRARLRRTFAKYPNQDNPYVRQMFLGQHLEPVPARGSVIRFEHADAAAFLESIPAQSFDCFSLSNIMDGISRDYRKRLTAAIRRAGTPAATLVLRSFREPLDPRSAELASQDRAMIWGSVYVGPAL